MSAIDNLPPLREIIASHGLSAKKSLGQNFLLDLNLTAKIARQAGSLDDHDILEIGPGPGGLTRGLLAQGARRVVAIERDRRCIAALNDIATAYPGRLKIIEGDALTIDPWPQLTHPVRVIANLPYNIGTELLIRWLTPAQWPPKWASLTLMFQREVADRIVATPGNKAYGRLAILANWRANTSIALSLPREAFTPPPKVQSAVVHIQPLPQPRFEADWNILEKLVADAFGQRRKMMRACLKHWGNIEDNLQLANINPTTRPEQVSIEQFCGLARLYQKNS